MDTHSHSGDYGMPGWANRTLSRRSLPDMRTTLPARTSVQKRADPRRDELQHGDMALASTPHGMPHVRGGCRPLPPSRSMHSSFAAVAFCGANLRSGWPPSMRESTASVARSARQCASIRWQWFRIRSSSK